MSIQRYLNDDAQTVLASAMAIDATTLVLANTTLWPTDGQTTIRIDDEKMVLSGATGPTYSVLRAQEGSIAAAHAKGAAVVPVLTAGSLEVLRNSYVTPEMFGATGSGDETAAVQAAIDYGVAHNLAVQLQRRDYHVTGLKANNVGDPSARPIANLSLCGAPGVRAYNGTATQGTRLIVTTPASGTVVLDVQYVTGLRLDNIGIESGTPAAYNGTGINLGHSPFAGLSNCTVDGYGVGLLADNSGLLQLANCSISNCNVGASLTWCGDSMISDCYFNTNHYDYSGSDLPSGCGLFLDNCGNSKVSGGKVEWNRKGILVNSASGYVFDGITFDECAEWGLCLSNSSSKNATAVYATNTNSISVTGCRFLSCGGVGDLGTSQLNGASLSIYRAASVAVTCCTFADGGPHAYDGNLPTGGEFNSPKYAFIRNNLTSGVVISGTAFHATVAGAGGPSPTLTRPLHVYDAAASFRSMVQFQGNSTIVAPQMGYYGDGSSETRTYHVFERDSLGRKRAYSITDSAPTGDGTFDVGDIVFKASAAATGWRCTVAGTFGTLATTVTAATTATSKVITLSAALLEDKLAVGDWITISGVTGAKKILRIDHPDGSPMTLTVDSACDATVATGALAYQEPTMTAFP